MSAGKDIGWMYDGAKSDVNREDYLLGKRIDKNFEKYSDAVKVQKPDAIDTVVSTRTVVRTSSTDHKISALQKGVIKNEDPLVAVKLKEELKRRDMLENPMMKLKFQNLLKQMMEKDAKKKSKKDKKKKKKKSKKESSDESESEEEPKKKEKRERSRSRERRSPERRKKSVSPRRNREERERRERSRSQERRETQRRRRHDSDSPPPRKRSASPRVSKRDDTRDLKRRRDSPSRERRRSPEDSRRRRRDSSSLRRRTRHDSSSPERKKSPDHRRKRRDSSSPRRRTRHDSSSPDRKEDSPKLWKKRRDSASPERRRRHDSSSPERKKSKSPERRRERRKSSGSPPPKRRRSPAKTEHGRKSRSTSPKIDDEKKREKSPSKIYDSHIPEQFRVQAGGSSDEEEEAPPAHYDREENEKKKKFEGYGLVGVKKKEKQDEGDAVNPYKLSKLPTAPIPAKREKRRPLTEEEKAAKLKEFQDNASWRKETRHKNMQKAVEEDEKEAEEESQGKAPSFIRSQLNSAAADLSMEQRLASNKRSLQRSHGYMEKKFTTR